MLGFRRFGLSESLT